MKLTIFQRFFLFCSGTNIDLLEEISPKYQKNDVIKQAAIGATILLTGLAASISGGYALYVIFDDNLYLALPFALFWGILIFNLDRYIVLSMSGGKPWPKVLQSIPRLFLAIIIAFVISRPLELKIFDKEINQVLGTIKEDSVQVAINQVELILLEDFRLDSTFFASAEKKHRDLAAATTQRADSIYQKFIEETKGTGGSRKKGYGPIARGLEADHKKLSIQAENYTKLADEQAALLTDLRNKFPVTLKENRINTRDNIESNFSHSIMARNDALWKLENDPDYISIYYSSWLIRLLFILLETAPVFSKIISRETQYDAVKASYEEKNKLERIRNSFDEAAFLDQKKREIEHYKNLQEYNLQEKAKLEKELFDDAILRAKNQYNSGVNTNPKSFVSGVLGRSYSWLFHPANNNTQVSTNSANPPSQQSSQPLSSNTNPSTSSTPVPSGNLRASGYSKWVIIIIPGLFICFLGFLFVKSQVTPEFIRIDSPNPDEYVKVPVSYPDSFSVSTPEELDTNKVVPPIVSQAPLIPDLAESIVLASDPNLSAKELINQLGPNAELTLQKKHTAEIMDDLVPPKPLLSTELEKGDTIKLIRKLSEEIVLPGSKGARRFYGFWLEAEDEDGNQGAIFSYFTKVGFELHCKRVEEQLVQNPFKVRDSPLIVREEPLANATNLTELEYNEEFTIVKREPELTPLKLKKGGYKYGYWCKVNSKGIEGYIFDYFTFKGLDYFYCLKEKGKLPKSN